MAALAVYDDGSGTALWAAGAYPTAATEHRIARWNGATWELTATGLSAGSDRPSD